MPNPTDTARALVAEFESKIEDLNYATMSSAEWSRARAEEAANTARAALLAHVAGVERERECCRWTYMDWPASNSDYETPCKGGGAWSFNDGDLASNGVIYCPFCGGKIVAPEEPNSCCECGEEHDGEAATCARCQDEIDNEIDNRDAARGGEG